MNNGWIKLHRKILDNEHLANDNTACLLFIKLLLVTNKKTGTYTTGRYKLSLLSNEKPATIYKALKRLEKWGNIELSSNNKRTTIRICNYEEYQEQSNNKVTTKEQQSNNKVTLNKKEELRKKNNNYVVELQQQSRRIYDHYIKIFQKNENQYKLTPARKKKLGMRVKQNGEQQIIKAIEFCASSPFHQGDNDRGWTADLDFIIRSQEQVEKLANQHNKATESKVNLKEYA